MRTYYRFLHFRIGLLISCVLFIHVTYAQSNYNVLFIGNSLTYVNDLPGMINNIATSDGNSLNHSSHTPGGSSLSSLHYYPNAIAKITQQPWDYVILQGQSTEAIVSQNHNHFFMQSVANLVHRITQNGSKAVFYMTFANNDINNDYNKIQTIIANAYIYAGNMTHSVISPVGLAWQQSLKIRPDLVLHQADGVHPTVMGTYLTACVFYTSLYCDSPLGLWHPASISQQEAAHFQQIAHDLIFDSLLYWNMDACAALTLNPPLTSDHIRLFPNPASTEFRVSVPGKDSSALKIDIFSQDGRLVKSEIFPEHEHARIDVTDLPSGLFTVALETAKQTVRTKLIITK